MSKDKYIKSPLNYTGGKFNLLPQIMPLIPKNLNTFVDLFGGGFNVGINTNANKIIYNEINDYLVELFKEFNYNTVDNIINHIESRIEEYNLTMENEEGFKSFREYYNMTKNPLDLYVLVCFSFNYQIRFNNNHEFNNPFGRNRSRFNPSLKMRLIEFIDTLQSKNIKFYNKDFINFDYSKLGNNDLVYCDPPYLITTGVYNDGKRGFKGWSEKEELELLNILDNLEDKGINFALSNVLEHKGSTNEILLNWSKKYHVNYLNYDYSNCNYQTKDKSTNSSVEVLITNYKIDKINHEEPLQLEFL